MENINVLREVNNRIDDKEHDICLYVPDTGEVIYINDNLKKLISLYYKDQLQAAQKKESEGA